MTYINPWYRPGHGSGPTLTYKRPPLLIYRGVEVFKNPAGLWDYALDGMVITQRAGFERDRACAIIDGLLALEDPLMCEAVRAHIEAHLSRLDE